MRVTVAEGRVKGDYIDPLTEVTIASGPPLGVAVERARYCGFPVTIVSVIRVR
jgi:hypothetical protein